MKKLLLLIFIIAAAWSQTSVAQNFGIVLFEDFDVATAPVDWTQTTDQTFPTGISSTTPSDGWEYGAAPYSSMNWNVPASLDASPFALSNDDVTDQNRLDDILISPILNLANFDSAIFLYDVFYDSLFQASQGYFLISYDAGAIWLTVPLTATTFVDGWVEDGTILPRTITVGVDQYTFNDQMMIGFVHTDRGGWGSGIAIDNVIVAGYNNPCDDVITIASCNAPQTVTLAGQGIVDFNFESACTFDVPGAEQLYSFTPTTTGTHTLSITAAEGNSWIDYMWKEASTGCDTLGWTCIGDANAPGNYSINLTSGTEYLFLLDNEFSTSETQTFSIICPAVPGEPCLVSADTWGDLGSAPCVDGGCEAADPGYINFGIYGSETYTLTNVQATYDYVFDVCAGVGAGSWIPEIVILAPDGTTIDAWNGEPATGSTLTHADQCSLEWTATQSGTYSIIINELGTANGDAPGQVDCTTSFATDNGNPTVLCGTNPAPCPVCEAGTLTSPAVQDLCPGESFDVALSGNSTPGSYTLFFDNTTSGGTGGIEAPVSITGYVQGDFPMMLDEDLNGTLSLNTLPPFAGTWEVKVIVVDGVGMNCDSTASFTVNFLTSADPACQPIGIQEAEAVDVKIYPNPSNGQFVVEVNGVDSDAQITVMDVTGRQVYTEGVIMNGNFRKELNLDIASGTYLLQISTVEGKVTRKIQIN
ncbi:MAG: hypothetical protein ACI9UR_002525 [Bacteroidia bacterium]|jgi:hypothetical protein